MFSDLLQEAYNAMRHNRDRTALTMRGIGIATPPRYRKNLASKETAAPKHAEASAAPPN